MSTITLAVPEEMKREMEELPEINWSEIAREAIREKMSQFKILKSIVAKSKLTEEDALELGRKVKKSMHERYLREYSGA